MKRVLTGIRQYFNTLHRGGDGRQLGFWVFGVVSLFMAGMHLTALTQTNPKLLKIEAANHQRYMDEYQNVFNSAALSGNPDVMRRDLQRIRTEMPAKGFRAADLSAYDGILWRLDRLPGLAASSDIAYGMELYYITVAVAELPQPNQPLSVQYEPFYRLNAFDNVRLLSGIFFLIMFLPFAAISINIQLEVKRRQVLGYA